MIVALAVAFGIIAFVYLIDKDSRAETSKWGNRLRVLSAIILACFVGAFIFFPEPFEAAAHWIAAILIFVIIGAVVFINAYLVRNQDMQDRKTRERFYRRYRVIAWAMVGSVIGALIVAAMGMSSHLHGDAWNIPVFALEAALLLEFAVFWALQTVELWNYADRTRLPRTRSRRRWLHCDQSLSRVLHAEDPQQSGFIACSCDPHNPNCGSRSRES